MRPYLCQRDICLKVELKPCQLDQDWKTHLYHTICLKHQNKCTRQDGYIIHILHISNINDQYITRTNGHVMFVVNIQADCILPKIGDELDAVVDMIFPHGVFCHHQMLRMMMPKCKQLQIRQEFSTNSLFHVHSKKVIRKGDIIRVVIDDVRFENDLYSCIVKMI